MLQKSTSISPTCLKSVVIYQRIVHQGHENIKVVLCGLVVINVVYYQVFLLPDSHHEVWFLCGRAWLRGKVLEDACQLGRRDSGGSLQGIRKRERQAHSYKRLWKEKKRMKSE